MGLPKPTHLQDEQEKVSKRIRNSERLTHKEVVEFMQLNGISDQEMALIFGVTIQAVRLWKSGQRDFSVTNSRLVRLFQRYPKLLREF